jgi:pimeloyl-ACP methyl ester carboxylesterase
MSVVQETIPPPSTALRLLEIRVLPEFGAFWLIRPWLSSVAPQGDGHPVLVLPGLLADDSSTYALRSFLNSHGYNAHGWEEGRNLGLRPDLERHMLAHIDELLERYGHRRISLIGWSLGGLYARQLAKMMPDKVRCLISLGSPFAGSPKSTNAWRTYETVSGSKIENQTRLDTLAEPPPVPPHPSSAVRMASVPGRVA